MTDESELDAGEWGLSVNTGEVVIKIGSTLKKLLESQRLSLRDLAKASGVPYSTLQEWSSNRPPKNPVQVQKVASALKVTMHFLIFGEEDQEQTLQRILKEEVFAGTFEISEVT